VIRLNRWNHCWKIFLFIQTVSPPALFSRKRTLPQRIGIIGICADPIYALSLQHATDQQIAAILLILLVKNYKKSAD
jgi:hypothetical protein